MRISRLWGFRHIRYWRLKRQLFGRPEWSSPYLGRFFRDSDLKYLAAVWRGEE